MKNAIVLFLFLTQKNSVSFSKRDLHWHWFPPHAGAAGVQFCRPICKELNKSCQWSGLVLIKSFAAEAQGGRNIWCEEQTTGKSVQVGTRWPLTHAFMCVHTCKQLPSNICACVVCRLGAHVFVWAEEERVSREDLGLLEKLMQWKATLPFVCLAWRGTERPQVGLNIPLGWRRGRQLALRKGHTVDLWTHQKARIGFLRPQGMHGN